MASGELKIPGDLTGENPDSLEFPEETLARSAIMLLTPTSLKFDYRYHSQP